MLGCLACTSKKSPQESKVHPHIYLSPLELYSSTNLKAKIYKIAATTNLIAILALTSSILAVACLSSIESLPIFLFGLTFAIPFMGMSYTSLKTKGYEFAKEAKIYKYMSKKYADLPSKYEDLKVFLRKLGLAPEIFNPKPELDYRPALARFTFWNDYHLNLLGKAEKFMNSNPETQEKKKYCVLRAHRIYEAKALKAKLYEAYALHVLQNPASKSTLESLGTIQICSFEDRCIMQLFEKKDTYFLFNDKKLKPLERQEIIDLDINTLTKRLFAADQNRQTISS